MADVFDGGGRKVTTAAIIRNLGDQYLVVRRAAGDFNNPGKLSFPGSDGRNLDGLVGQLASRLNLQTNSEDWRLVGDAFNPHNNGPAGEMKTVWLYQCWLKKLPAFSPQGHEKGKYAALMWLSTDELRSAHQQGDLSPAAWSVIDTFPGLFCRG